MYNGLRQYGFYGSIVLNLWQVWKMMLIVFIIYLVFSPILIWNKKVEEKFPKIAIKAKFFWHFSIWIWIFLLGNFYIVILALTDLFQTSLNMRSPADYFVALVYALISISLPSFLILHFFYTYKSWNQSHFEHWYYGLKQKRNCY